MEEHRNHEFLSLRGSIPILFSIVRTATINSTCLSILVEFCCKMTTLQHIEIVVIFMPYFQSIDTHTVWTVVIAQIYIAHLMVLQICFRKVQVKDITFITF